MTRYFKHSFRVGLMLALLSTAAFSSLASGSLTGLVKDPSGAVVAGANITLTLVSECKCSDCSPEQPPPCAGCCTPQRSATSNSEGEFRFEGIPGGEYRLELSASGFKKHTVQVTLRRGEQASQDITLDVGDVSGQFEVTSGGSRRHSDQRASAAAAGIKSCGFFCSLKKFFGKIF